MSGAAGEDGAPAAPRRPEPSLVRRLIWLAAAWILVALVVTGAVLTAFFSEASVRRLEHSAREIVEILVAGTAVEADGEVVAPPVADARSMRIYGGKYWQVAEFDAEAGIRPLSRSQSLWDYDLGPPPNLDDLSQLGREVRYDLRGPRREPLRGLAMSARIPGRDAPLIFIAAVDRAPIDADIRSFAAVTWGALALLGLGLVLAVVMQVRVGLAPLFDLRREVAEVRKGKIHRLAGAYPVEISPLAGELNGLLEHNAEVVERQRTHVGNLAHALKTPLAVMLAESERHPGELSGVVRRQTDLMRAQVDHHLRRARAAARAQTAGERTSVEEVLDELATLLERVFEEKGVEIDWRCPEDLCFQGERQDLQEIAGNVLENACKWGVRRVRASAVAGPREGRMVLTVEDDGPGVSEDRLGEVLKRGARLDEATPGSGLGLSIVDELARAYGGGVSLGRSPTLGGLRVEIELPAAET